MTLAAILGNLKKIRDQEGVEATPPRHLSILLAFPTLGGGLKLLNEGADVVGGGLKLLNEGSDVMGVGLKLLNEGANIGGGAETA